MMYKVLVSDPISDMGIQMLYDAADVEVVKQTGLSEDELVSIIGEYDAPWFAAKRKLQRKL